jgi:hypothetical protein
MIQDREKGCEEEKRCEEGVAEEKKRGVGKVLHTVANKQSRCT